MEPEYTGQSVLIFNRKQFEEENANLIYNTYKTWSIYYNLKKYSFTNPKNTQLDEPSYNTGHDESSHPPKT